jgi:hypothetical protein
MDKEDVPQMRKCPVSTMVRTSATTGTIVIVITEYINMNANTKCESIHSHFV